MDEQPTERQKYIDNLESKLRKSGRAKRFQGSEDGAIITDYLTQQINSIVKNIGGTKYINDHNTYVYDTGQLSMAQKILTMLNSEANVDTQSIVSRIDEAKADES